MFRERGREGERGEKHQCVVVLPCTPSTGDLACKPGVCPDWDLTGGPLGGRQTLNPLGPTSHSHSLISRLHCDFLMLKFKDTEVLRILYVTMSNVLPYKMHTHIFGPNFQERNFILIV